MARANPYNQFNEYQKNAVSTSSQGTLILMMYDGAIKFTRMALECDERKDVGGKAVNIKKSHDIITELRLSLNMKKGGEISRRLDGLYQFMQTQLIRANIKSDREALNSVLGVLKPLREAWENIFQSAANLEVEPAPPPPANKRFRTQC